MAAQGHGLSGEAISNPGNLRVYLNYKSLRSRDLGRLLSGLSAVYEKAVTAATGSRTLVFVRGNKRIRVRPELDVIESVTGNSIKLVFSEGWIPKASIENDELVVGIPKKTAIPLLVAYFLLQAASYSLDVTNKAEDLRLKHLDLQLKQIELKLKEEDLVQKISPRDREILQVKASRAVKPLLKNKLINTCSINGLPIK